MDYSLELKKTVRPDFTVPPTWREEFYRRLQAKGVTLDHAQYEQAAPEIDRLLGNTVARLAFGDSTAKRRSVSDDNQLTHALQVLTFDGAQIAAMDMFLTPQIFPRFGLPLPSPLMPGLLRSHRRRTRPRRQRNPGMIP